MSINTILVDPIGLPPLGQVGKLANITRYLGDASVPRDIKRQRANNLTTMRRFGAPVIVKHMYNDQDVQVGIAEPSPNFSSVYGQVRHGDPLSHGVGFVSVEKATDEWVTPDGKLYLGTTPPSGSVSAPKYRGYGPGYLTYAIMPDVAEDVFKLNEAGALIKVQTAQAQMGWFPEVNDNDLLITCRLDQGDRILETRERYLLKMTNPISIRGLDRKGRREYGEDFGNRHITDQYFEMTLIPTHDELYRVEVDR
jgi:hypothetical protein